MKKILSTLLFCVSGLWVMAQFTVEGVVTDKETGKPVVSASVIVKGMNISTLTDVNGRFLLVIPDSRMSLWVSCKDYETQEVNHNETNIVEVILEPISTKRVYVGWGSGIDNICGLIGLRGEVVIAGGLSASTGFGLGSWGYKTGLHLNYYFSGKPIGAYVRGGISHATGLFGEYAEMDMEVERRVTVTTTTQVPTTTYANGLPTVRYTTQTSTYTETKADIETIELGFKPMQTVDLGFGYAVKIGSRVKFLCEVGYCLAVQAPQYSVKLADKEGTTSPKLTEVSTQSIELSAPGGPNLGLGLVIGF